jgi:FtsH-binding integral membrane protein
MSDFDRGLTRQGAATADVVVDAGLRSFMLGVYNKLGLGLVLSAALAYVTGTVPAVSQLLWRSNEFGHRGYTLLGMVVAFAPIGIILFSNFVRNQSPRAAGVIYWSIVALIGASLGSVFMVYQNMAVFQTFLVTAAAFGGLSLVGYTTKRDLSGMRSFLVMGLIGLIVAMFAGLFFHSPAMMFAINVIGVLIFAGFIAYHTQALKGTYYQLGGNEAAMSVATNYGALSLYLDFINLFSFLLNLMGGGRR